MTDTSTETVTALLEGVTPGPWREFIDDSGDRWTGWPLSIYCDVIEDKTIVRTGGLWPYEWDAKTSQFEACANARFIAAARELVPALLAERDAANARAERARAEGMREAAAWHEERAKDEDALSSKYRGGSNPWFAHVQMAKIHRDSASAILAAADKLEGKS